MPPSEDKKPLRGLARSIDALFDEPGPARPGDVVWEPVEDPSSASRADEADPAAFEEALETFLASAPLARVGQARGLRDHAAALRDAGMLDALGDAVERLAVASGDPPDEACLAMARQLLTPGVASRMTARLGTTHDEVRREELVSLSRILGHDMALAVADALSNTTDRSARRIFLDAMVAMMPEAVDVVEGMVHDGRWFVVRNAIAILGEAEGEGAAELITSGLAHTDPRVRREALLALARMGGDEGSALVPGMIADPDADVRLAAAMAAGALKAERAVRPLLALLDDESDPEVIVGVLHALGQIGDPGAVNTIEKRAVGSFFSRPPPEVRIAAYRALEHIGTPRARQLLDEATDDKDPAVRTAVRHLLRDRAANQDGGAPLSP